VSDYFRSLGDYQALSQYKLKFLLKEIKESYDSDLRNYGQQLGSLASKNKQT
jgi:hypothetical protein